MHYAISVWERLPILPSSGERWIDQISFLALVLGILITCHTFTLCLPPSKCISNTAYKIRAWCGLGVAVTLSIGFISRHIEEVVIMPQFFSRNLSERLLFFMGGIIAALILAVVTRQFMLWSPLPETAPETTPPKSALFWVLSAVAVLLFICDIIPVVTLRGTYLLWGNTLGLSRSLLEKVDTFRLAYFYAAWGIVVSAFIIRLNQRAIMLEMRSKGRCTHCGFNAGTSKNLCPECGNCSN